MVNPGLHVMLVPRDGFRMVLGAQEVAAPGTSEALLTAAVGEDAEVDAVLDRAEAAGAVVHTRAGRQPWGHSGRFADPDGHRWMVMNTGMTGKD